MNDDQRSPYVTRNDLLKLLSDEEVASVCRAETKARLAAGDEYLDLTQLQHGVQKARGTTTSLSSVLPRSAVHDETWRKILAQLSATPISAVRVRL